MQQRHSCCMLEAIYKFTPINTSSDLLNNHALTTDLVLNGEVFREEPIFQSIRLYCWSALLSLRRSDVPCLRREAAVGAAVIPRAKGRKKDPSKASAQGSGPPGPWGGQGYARMLSGFGFAFLCKHHHHVPSFSGRHTRSSSDKNQRELKSGGLEFRLAGPGYRPRVLCTNAHLAVEFPISVWPHCR